MASLAFLMLAWGALGLTIESDAPDAHCPPVTEVREAVAARVGDVQGDDYDVRYGLVRDVQTGLSFVTLVVRHAQNGELLRREIPLSEGSCSDVALAIAVILERYFAGVIRPRGSEVAPSAAEPEASEEPEKPQKSQSPAVRPEEGAPGEIEDVQSKPPGKIVPGEPKTWRKLLLRGAVGVGSGPQPTFHLALGRQLSRFATAFAELALFPVRTAPQDPTFDEQSAFSGIQFGVELATAFGRALEFGAAPYAGLGIERALVMDPTVKAAGTRSRVVATLGAQLRMGFSLKERSSMGLLLHGTALVGGKRFVVEDEALSQEVLTLPAARSDVGFYFAHRF